MKLAISQVCTLAAPMERDLEEYAASGIEFVEVWFTKLEQFLVSHTLDDLRRLRDRYGVVTPVGSLQGGLFAREAAAREAAWELFRQRLGLCREAGIEVIVVACDVPAPATPRHVDGVRASLRTMADWGRQYGVRMALEFQATAGLGNNLQTAAAFVMDVDDPWLGICLDTFHFAVGPSKMEDLTLLTPANLLHVQLSDLAGRLREFAADGDRILPGDGDIPLEPLIRHLHAIDYQGVVSVEVMNPQIGRISARQVSETCLAALRRVMHDGKEDG